MNDFPLTKHVSLMSSSGRVRHHTHLALSPWASPETQCTTLLPQWTHQWQKVSALPWLSRRVWNNISTKNNYFKTTRCSFVLWDLFSLMYDSSQTSPHISFHMFPTSLLMEVVPLLFFGYLFLLFPLFDPDDFQMPPSNILNSIK